MIFALAFMAACLSRPPGYDYGRVSWYGHESAKHRMANGSHFNPHAMTAASYAYPLGTEVEVTNLVNGRRVVVTITDRGPARHLDRIIDVSEAAAKKLGAKRDGVIQSQVMIRKFK